MKADIAEKIFKVRDQRHDQSECGNGGGLHFDGLESSLACLLNIW